MTFARFIALAFLLVATPLQAGQIHVAAAADLRFAMDEIVSLFEKSHPDDRIEVSYGSSGKFYAQIRNGAPFDQELPRFAGRSRQTQVMPPRLSAPTPIPATRFVAKAAKWNRMCAWSAFIPSMLPAQSPTE